MRASKRNLGNRASVEVDWFGELPEAHLQVFERHTSELEAAYLMFSVSLDEAIGLHESGFLTHSRQGLTLTAALCGHLNQLLENLLSCMVAHCQQYGTIPSIKPLNPRDFHGNRSRFSAIKSLIWHGFLRSRNLQFRNKIDSLRSMVRKIGSDFCIAVEALVASQGIAVDSSDLWTVMDVGHFDLNTCFRESVVLLKCFLMVLPDDELRPFQEIGKSPSPAESHVKAKAAASGKE